MKINQKLLEKDRELQENLNKFDKELIYVLHWKYNYSFSNFWKNPLLIIMKIFNFFDKGKGLDHSCHICRFVQDGDNVQVRIFEATTDRGMEENDLISRLKRFKGTCWIEALSFKVDKIKAKEFENKYLGVEYSKLAAALAGLDGAIDKLNIKTNGGFCSFLVAAFLKDQGIEPFIRMNQKEIMEITPSDLFDMNLGVKQILYKA